MGPDWIPDALQGSHHDSISSDPPCLQNDDESLWTTFMLLDEDATTPAFDTSMELDELQQLLLLVLSCSWIMLLLQIQLLIAFKRIITCRLLELRLHHCRSRSVYHPQPQQQNLAPPPFVPLQNNNARAQQWQQQQHPRSFSEDGPLKNIADLLNCRPSFLLSKKLTSSNTNLSQCRLSVPVPKTAVRANFKRPIFSQEDIHKFNSKDGLELTAFDQNGEEYTMRFKLLKSCGTYILLGKWKEFLQNNKLPMPLFCRKSLGYLRSLEIPFVLGTEQSLSFHIRSDPLAKAKLEYW